MQGIVTQTKAIIHEVACGVSVLRILLFGSCAPGDAHADSDWDFLVVTNREPLARILGGESRCPSRCALWLSET